MPADNPLGATATMERDQDSRATTSTSSDGHVEGPERADDNQQDHEQQQVGSGNLTTAHSSSPSPSSADALPDAPLQSPVSLDCINNPTSSPQSPKSSRKSKSKHKHKDKEKSKSKHRSRSKDKDKDKSSRKSKSKDKSRSKSKDKDKDKSKKTGTSLTASPEHQDDESPEINDATQSRPSKSTKTTKVVSRSRAGIRAIQTTTTTTKTTITTTTSTLTSTSPTLLGNRPRRQAATVKRAPFWFDQELVDLGSSSDEHQSENESLSDDSADDENFELASDDGQQSSSSDDVEEDLAQDDDEDGNDQHLDGEDEEDYEPKSSRGRQAGAPQLTLARQLQMESDKRRWASQCLADIQSNKSAGVSAWRKQNKECTIPRRTLARYIGILKKQQPMPGRVGRKPTLSKDLEDRVLDRLLLEAYNGVDITNEYIGRVAKEIAGQRLEGETDDSNAQARVRRCGGKDWVNAWKLRYNFDDFSLPSASPSSSSVSPTVSPPLRTRTSPMAQVTRRANSPQLDTQEQAASPSLADESIPLDGMQWREFQTESSILQDLGDPEVSLGHSMDDGLSKADSSSSLTATTTTAEIPSIESTLPRAASSDGAFFSL